MKKVNKELWVNLLVSGEYEQTRNTFSRQLGDGGIAYCAIGCLLRRTNPKLLKSLETQNIDLKTLAINLEMQPQEIERLIELNDDEERTFQDIAIWIDHNLIID